MQNKRSMLDFLNGKKKKTLLYRSDLFCSKLLKKHTHEHCI